MSSLPVGSQAITAVCSGDPVFSPSTSAVLSQRVNHDDAATQITSSVKLSVYGQAVTFIATATADAPGSGTPTGSATFYDGTLKLGTGTLGNRKPTITYTFLAVSAPLDHGGL